MNDGHDEVVVVVVVVWLPRVRVNDDRHHHRRSPRLPSFLSDNVCMFSVLVFLYPIINSQVLREV